MWEYLALAINQNQYSPIEPSAIAGTSVRPAISTILTEAGKDGWDLAAVTQGQDGLPIYILKRLK